MSKKQRPAWRWVIALLVVTALAIASFPLLQTGYLTLRGVATEAGVLPPRVCIREVPPGFYRSDVHLMGDSVDATKALRWCDEYERCAVTHDIAEPEGLTLKRPSAANREYLASLPLCADLDLGWNERIVPADYLRR